MQATFDHDWHRLALAGDTEAVSALAAKALEPLYTFCLYRVGCNRYLCEEVVQETLVRAIRDLERYEPERAGGNIFPWLTGLARNEIHRVLARERVDSSLESLWKRVDGELLDVFARLESDPFDDELLQREETRQMVNAAMSQLSPHYQEALEAKYVDEQSVRDLARRWSISEKAVESQLSRARKAFRATFLALCRNLEPEVLCRLGFQPDQCAK